MMLIRHLLPLAALSATALGHGYVSSPPARAPGEASIAACGNSVVNDIKKDNTSHVEGLPELAATDAGYHADQCNLWLCRGLQFGDNAANVQKFTPGQSVQVKIKLAIPHAGGANVSVVDTKKNAIIGKSLISWASGYADEQQFYSGKTPEDQVDFNVTIPTDLGSACAEAGACVLQWWWYGTGARQTYESCVDFTVASAAANSTKRFNA
ncbi:uncharacterized protein BCR38DRAFT_481909 [Pseudomassariella vexata]|uniref:Chitin-binding type-4 domain-containing protein n=1 Tax=Pseudomassariella vexata TaxID=1141098 RepID=A0A1Y2EAK0_9PEZI|nr:uncharacterized protein BCR38DRAFT_481909 [Pseudomassariella vexata]ORY68417.1 hypothetical protein BCR38DRAFT_481909 [Pseudomassariella vexata]